jgi:hypothetical protein
VERSGLYVLRADNVQVAVWFEFGEAGVFGEGVAEAGCVGEPGGKIGPADGLDGAPAAVGRVGGREEALEGGGVPGAGGIGAGS